MIVNATEFKTKVGKYLELVQNEPIVITRYGKELARLVRIDGSGSSNVDFLYGLLADADSNGDEDVVGEAGVIRSERIREKYEGLD